MRKYKTSFGKQFLFTRYGEPQHDHKINILKYIYIYYIKLKVKVMLTA